MIKHRTHADVVLFVRTMQKAGLDPVAVGAVIESESGWLTAVHGPKAFTDPPGYAVGLIQFAPATARMLGTSSAALERMTFAQQLRYVVKYYQQYGGGKNLKRPVDYYLAGWGAGVGTDDSHVLASEGQPAYQANTGFDTQGKGTITTGDLDSRVQAMISKARANGTLPIVIAAAAGLEWIFWIAVGWLVVRHRKAHA